MTSLSGYGSMAALRRSRRSSINPSIRASARWAVENITKEQIEEMEEVLYMSEYYRKKELWEQVYICDNKFHHLIYIYLPIFHRRVYKERMKVR